MPKFFGLFPEARLPALWSEYKNVQLNPNTALDAKTKQLIGLAVAAQAQCLRLFPDVRGARQRRYRKEIQEPSPSQKAAAIGASS